MIVKMLSRPTVLVALFALAACSGGGTMNSSVPGGSQPVQAPAQSQDRSTLGNAAKPAPKPKAPACGAKTKDPDWCLFDDAMLINPGDNSPTAVQLSWDPNGGSDGGVDFGIPAGLTVSQLNNLSTDFKFTQGTCSQGSPRFQINVDNKNVFVYLGPQFPSLTNPCAGATYSNSGNVISPTSLVDATQLGAGYETWSAFQASFGSHAVQGIQLVVDGFTTPNIYAQFDNTQINGTTVTYEKNQTGDGDNDKDDKTKPKHGDND